MSEDLQTNLNTYKVQLQQVEASLTSDPDNEDLVKLQKDLLEVIDLTLELLSQNAKTSKSDHTADSPSETHHAGIGHTPTAVRVEGHAELETVNPEAPSHNWKVGDTCLALYPDDGGHYQAVIEEFLDDGTCTVTFQSYGNTELTQVHLLKPLEERTEETGEGASPNKPKSKKDLIAQQREYKRKKTQKKQQRQKQIAEERETEKNKWLNFNSKTFSKTSKGKVKKSIFATTDQVQGRVGVGTCGTSGRPMTTYTHQEKWKKS